VVSLPRLHRRSPTRRAAVSRTIAPRRCKCVSRHTAGSRRSNNTTAGARPPLLWMCARAWQIAHLQRTRVVQPRAAAVSQPWKLCTVAETLLTARQHHADVITPRQAHARRSWFRVQERCANLGESFLPAHLLIPRRADAGRSLRLPSDGSPCQALPYLLPQFQPRSGRCVPATVADGRLSLSAKGGEDLLPTTAG